MLSELELARRSDGKIEIRSPGLRVHWDLKDLVTSDGQAAVGSFSAVVGAVNSSVDLRMLEESLLAGRASLTTAEAAAHFAPAILSAAKQIAGSFSVNELLGNSGLRQMADALLQAAKPVAFACGMEVLPPVEIQLDSPTLRQRRAEEMLRQTAQKRAADQVDHLRRSAELLSQFQILRNAAPQLGPGQLLERIGLADRSDLLQSLLLANADQTACQKLWVVAGTSLIEIKSDDSPVLHPLPDLLGPIRSVRGDGTGGFLLGCQRGILRADAQLKETIAYQDSQTISPLGFNAAVATGERIWATHHDGGLVSWALNQPDKPDIAIRQIRARSLATLDSGRLIFCNGKQLAVVSAGGQVIDVGLASPADYLAALVQSDRVLAVREDGIVSILSIEDWKEMSPPRRFGRITAAATMPWLADVRLLLAMEDGPVVCIGPDDELVTQYTSPHRGPRVVAGSAHSLAAVSPDRQRLILWNPWDGRQLRAEIHLFSLARHRIADVVFA